VALRTHLGQPLIQKQGLSCLRILAVNDDIAVKIADTEGIEVVIDARRAHAGNAKVQQRAFRALLQIGMSNKDVQTQMKKLGVIEATEEAMNAQNATPKCRDKGQKLLDNFKFSFSFEGFYSRLTQQEEQETMRSKDTQFAAVKLLRCFVCGGVKVEWGRH